MTKNQFMTIILLLWAIGNYIVYYNTAGPMLSIMSGLVGMVCAALSIYYCFKAIKELQSK